MRRTSPPCFDLMGPDGEVIPADDLARVTAASLSGEFATVVGTAELIAETVPASRFVT